MRQSAIKKKINVLIQSLKEMYSKHLIDLLPDEEKESIFIKINLDVEQNVNIEVYNANTKAIIVKKYHLVKLLRECVDIFSVNNMVQRDCKVMYNKSKQKVFKQNTIINI